MVRDQSHNRYKTSKRCCYGADGRKAEDQLKESGRTTKKALGRLGGGRGEGLAHCSSEGPEILRVRLLGGFELSLGSQPVGKEVWRLKRAAGLVKLLALAPGHRMHREQAMDLLWPNVGKKSASNNLRQVLHAARGALDIAPGSRDRYLSLRDEQIVLCPGGQTWVDVEVFEESALVARRSRDPSAYRAAIDVYSGDLLPEDRYEPWAEARRQGLRRLYLELLVEAAAIYEERNEHGLAVEALRKATSKEPALEEAHAALMRLYALLGRPEQALTQYERLRDTLARGFATEPNAATRRLRDEAAAGRLSLVPQAPLRRKEEPPSAGRHNLPAARTSFVGREREMVEVKKTLAMTRLLTLTGAGGSGKTRLALEVARDLVGVYPDGVWLAELAPLSEGDLVIQAVAGALGVPERTSQALAETVLEALEDKQLLLVVDNCEHLVEAAARFVDASLDACPRLRVLATSREPLGIRGEVLWRVPPLSLPSGKDKYLSQEGLMRHESVRLFVERARLRLPAFELVQENAGAVARVCRRLDGMPLAIELATARMGALAVEQVAQRLEVSLDVLGSAGRSVGSRQQTLRATMDWSHDLLSQPEQALFRRLSVFAGGWTLETAEAVCPSDGIEPGEILDLLGGLVDKSLVVAEAGAADGAVRYRMLVTIRQYALGKLDENGEADEIQGRRAALFLAMAEEAEQELTGHQQRLWVERLEEEHDNLREALSWALERGEAADMGLRLCGALWRFWHTRGYLSEGARWLQRALSVGGGPMPARMKALEGMGWLAQRRGDIRNAEAAYEEMLALSRELDNKGNAATALNGLGTLAVAKGENERAQALLEENLRVLQRLEEEGTTDTTLKRFHVSNLLGILAINQGGDYARGYAHWEESLALARQAGDAFQVGTTLANLGYAALMRGDYGRASALCEEALVIAHELGSAGVEILPETLVNLGLAARGRGQYARAATSLGEALARSQEAGSKPSSINAVEGMAGLTGALGRDARAARLWGAAEAAREATGIALPPGDRALHEPYLAAARGRIGGVGWARARAEGRAMPLEEAVEHALDKGDGPDAKSIAQGSREGEPMSKLTGREREVALLVARGLTNRQISKELGVSERTAGNHVGNILRKLGLRSRAQIASWATEHRLHAPARPF